MRWYEFKIRQPNRWSKHAKADGSAKPELNRVKAHTKVPLYFWSMRIGFGLVFGSIVLPTLFASYIDPYSPVGNPQNPPNPTSIVSTLLIVLLTCFFVGMLCSYSMMYARRAIIRRAAAHRFHVCPRCAYPLSARTDDTLPCPECGQHISRREAIRLWARFCRK